jgi:hypothetical protein
MLFNNSPKLPPLISLHQTDANIKSNELEGFPLFSHRQKSSPNTFCSRHWPAICFPPGLDLDLAACPASGGNGGFTWIHRAQMGGIYQLGVGMTWDNIS